MSVWLNENQLLFSLLLLPVLSFIVAGVSAWYSAKLTIRSQAIERQHQSTTQISGFRQEWINELRTDFSEFLTFCSVAHLQPLTKDPNKVIENYQNIVRSQQKIRLRLNPNDPDFVPLMQLMDHVVLQIPDKIEAKQSVIGDAAKITVIMQKILKREWDRIRSDIEGETQ